MCAWTRTATLARLFEIDYRITERRSATSRYTTLLGDSDGWQLEEVLRPDHPLTTLHTHGGRRNINVAEVAGCTGLVI